MSKNVQVMGEISKRDSEEFQDLSDEEFLIIQCYRKSNDLTKDIIKKILDYDAALVNFQKGLNNNG